MNIAVDFDGTIVEHRFPYIGREIPFAFATLRKLQEEGHQIILWTAREGRFLQDAIEFCQEHGFTFYAINSNYSVEDQKQLEFSVPGRKLRNIDIYIDDRNLGGLPDWGVIYEIIHNNLTYEDFFRKQYQENANGTLSAFWKGLLGRIGLHLS